MSWSAPFPKLTDAKSRTGTPPAFPSSIAKGLVRHAHNIPVRAPRKEFAKIAYGQQRVFRTYSGSDKPNRSTAPMLTEAPECPRPILLWTSRDPNARVASVEAIPMVLLRYEYLPLGAISLEDLQAEGHRSISAYRHYWAHARHAKLGWRPHDLVNVFEVRPWMRDDLDGLGGWALEQLYGDFKDRWP